MYSFNDILYVEDNYNFTLAETKEAPYNLSSTLSKYYGDGLLAFNMDSCDSKDTVAWDGYLINQYWWNDIGYTHLYPNPVLNLQFDGRTANMTIDGYFFATPEPTGGRTFNPIAYQARGKVKISFFGNIDSYHSDILVNDSAIPTWKRTVGFNNNTLNVGDTSTSGALAQQFAAWVIAGPVLISLVILCMEFTM